MTSSVIHKELWRTISVSVKFQFFVLLFFGHVGKRLDKKTKVNFKIYDVTIGLINNYNARIVQHFKSKSNQRLKFGRLREYKVRNIVLQKTMQKMRQEGYFQISFLFFEKALYYVKATCLHLVSTYFDSSWLGHTIKTNWKTLDCWFRDMLNFDFIQKDLKNLRLVFPPHFLYDFSSKRSDYLYILRYWAICVL